MDSFYVVLPSNVPSLTDKENTLAQYITNLPKALEFNDDYEVGLCEISYTKSWYNVKKDLAVFSKMYSAFPKDEVSPFTKIEAKTISGVYKSGIIPAGVVKQGFYSSEDILIGEINKVILKYFQDAPGVDPRLCPQLIYNRTTGLTHIENIWFGTSYDKFLSTMHFDVDLFEMLGRVHGTPNESIKQFPININRGVHEIFCYTNIVRHSIVGNTYSQLLRIVEIPSDKYFGNQVVISYEKPHYYPLALRDLKQIEILLQDASGENIAFSFGRTTVLLHFRKIKNNF